MFHDRELLAQTMPAKGFSTMTVNGAATTADSVSIRRYNAFLCWLRDWAALLYGIDVGIIGGALPYWRRLRS